MGTRRAAATTGMGTAAASARLGAAASSGLAPLIVHRPCNQRALPTTRQGALASGAS